MQKFLKPFFTFFILSTPYLIDQFLRYSYGYHSFLRSVAKFRPAPLNLVLCWCSSCSFTWRCYHTFHKHQKLSLFISITLENILLKVLNYLFISENWISDISSYITLSGTQITVFVVNYDVNIASNCIWIILIRSLKSALQNVTEATKGN